MATLLKYDEGNLGLQSYCVGQKVVYKYTNHVQTFLHSSPESVADMVNKALKRTGFFKLANKKELPEENKVTSLAEAACEILSEGNPYKKAALSLNYARAWFDGKLKIQPDEDAFYPIPPDTPARNVETVNYLNVPKRGGGGNLKNATALVHSLAHIENVAIDLSWDIVVRYLDEVFAANLSTLFFDAWVRVGEDESRHFLVWSERLEELGSSYGALPTHDMLWNSAKRTSDSLMARLAVEHMALEARGLDVYLSSVQKFAKSGDLKSSELLTAIYFDEITHVEAGVRWYEALANLRGIEPVSTFRSLLKERFHGEKLKPPFNCEARTRAGMKSGYYKY